MTNEIGMTNIEYDLYRTFIYDVCGINLGSAKKNLLVTRLSKRLRTLGLSSFSDYHQHVMADPGQQELIQMLDAISTNKTEFFREKQHFDFLSQHVYPHWLNSSQVRIWSAGCSSGEEACTLAITFLEALNTSKLPGIKILATDISTKVLDQAEQGIYSQEKMAGIPMHLKQKYFLKGTNHWGGHFLIKEEIKKMIRFRRLNLMKPFPMAGKFDVIFCRNVMIYFDKPTQACLVEKFVQQLIPGGFLFIGHSESLNEGNTHLKYIQPSVYQKE